MSASMLRCSKCINDMIGSPDLCSIPNTGKKFSNGKKWWGLSFRILQLPISIFKVSFWTSLSSRKFQHAVLREVRAEEKESKNLFAVIRAEEKEKSTHRVNLDKTKCSSSQRKTRRREKRGMKEVECKKSNKPSNNYCKIFTLLLLNWKKYRL